MKERVARYIWEKRLIERGGKVLVGLSGGADSVALLMLLLELSSDMGFQVFAAHLNHGIRGESADRDERFVKALCENMEVPLKIGYADIPAMAKAESRTVEEMGRLVRYDFLRRTKEELGCDCIAVAHHADDQAESILMHLIRGSGLHGLTGMKPKRDDLIRPLLPVRKRELEEYLKGRGMEYCTDETNLVPDGTRNKLRLELVPYVESNLNRGFTEGICAMGELLREDDEYLEALAREALDKLKSGEGYQRYELMKLPLPILSRAIRMALWDAGAKVDIERSHIKLVTEFLNGRTGARLDLPSASVRTEYGLVIFDKAYDIAGKKAKDAEYELRIPGITMADDAVFEVETVEKPHGEKFTDFNADPFTAYMDSDKIYKRCLVRRRRAGDMFYPLGAPGAKKLKDYLIDKKVSHENRNRHIIVMGREVLFVPGCTVSELVRVTDETVHMLKIRYKDGV